MEEQPKQNPNQPESFKLGDSPQKPQAWPLESSGTPPATTPPAPTPAVPTPATPATSTSETPPLSTAQPAPKSNRKVILWISIGVVVLLAIGAGALFLFKKPVFYKGALTETVSTTETVKDLIQEPAAPTTPTCTLAADPKTVEKGKSSVLSLTASGDVTNFGLFIENQEVNELTVTPDATKTYKGSIKDTRTSTVINECSVEVTVTEPPPPQQEATSPGVETGIAETVSPPPAPTCTLTAAPETIELRSSSVLSLTTSGEVTGSLLIEDQTVTKQANQITVTPDLTKTYTGYIKDATGKTANTCSATVTVTQPPPPTCTLTATPETVEKGKTAALRLTVSGQLGGGELFIENQAVTPQANEITVTPDVTKTYKGSIKNASGNIVNDCTAQVSVTEPPPPETPLTPATCPDSTWNCTDWSECNTAGRETRTCTLVPSSCAEAATPSKPSEERSCSVGIYPIQPPTPLPETTVTETSAEDLQEEQIVALTPPIECPPDTLYDTERGVCVPPVAVVEPVEVVGEPKETPKRAAKSTKKKSTTKKEEPVRGAAETPKTVESGTTTVVSASGASPAPTPTKQTGKASTAKLRGAYIQGETGPEILLYPILIAAANGVYYLVRRKRKM